MKKLFIFLAACMMAASVWADGKVIGKYDYIGQAFPEQKPGDKVELYYLSTDSDDSTAEEVYVSWWRKKTYSDMSTQSLIKTIYVDTLEVLCAPKVKLDDSRTDDTACYLIGRSQVYESQMMNAARDSVWGGARLKKDIFLHEVITPEFYEILKNIMNEEAVYVHSRLITDERKERGERVTHTESFSSFYDYKTLLRKVYTLKNSRGDSTHVVEMSTISSQGRPDDPHSYRNQIRQLYPETLEVKTMYHVFKDGIVEKKNDHWHEWMLYGTGVLFKSYFYTKTGEWDLDSAPDRYLKHGPEMKSKMIKEKIPSNMARYLQNVMGKKLVVVETPRYDTLKLTSKEYHERYGK